MKLRKTKKLIIGLSIASILSVGGIVFGLNGFFGGGASIPSDTMTRGLVGYWNFEEGRATTTYDSSGNNNHGYFATAASSPAWTQGKVGSALSFDGTDDYVDAGSGQSLDITSTITIEAWAKVPAWSWPHAFVNGSIADKGASSYSVGYGLLAEDTSADFCFGFYSGGVHKLACSAGSQSTNTWLHLVGTYNGSTLTMYVNGQVSGTPLNYIGSIDSSVTRALSIGVDTGGPRYFAGLIDEVRIYNRALTAEEVRYHYNRGGPVAQWKFDEGSGLTAYDSSGNGNTGTLQNNMATTSWTSGKYGSALSFDGVNDYVNAGTKAIFSGTTYSASAWLKTTATARGHIIQVNASEGNAALTIAMSANAANGKISFYKHTGAGSDMIESSSAYNDGAWHFVQGIRNGANLYLYIDGVLVVNSTTAGTETKTVSQIYFGTYDTAFYFFNGLIDDVRIYNYARTADEIRLDYNAGFAAKFGPTGADCDRDPGSCMTKGLVGYWNFEDRRGTTTLDTSGNNNHGYFATAASSPAWTQGKVGSALSLDGSNDYVDAGNGTSLQAANNFTIELWLKGAASQVRNLRVPLSKGHSVSGGWVIQSISTEESGTLYFTYNDGAAWKTVYFTGYAPTDNIWHHLIVVKSSTLGILLYKDGVYLNGNVTATGDIPGITLYNLTIGQDSANADRFFTGLIDEVRVYNRALSASEVRYHYNRGGPVAQWKFDEGSGLTAYDSSGNGNTGTLQNNMATTSWTSGKYGSALSFDGVDDYVSVGTNSILTSSKGTIGLWIKTNLITGADLDQGFFILREANGLDYLAFALRNNRPRLFIEDGGVEYNVDVTSVDAFFNNTNWHYLVATQDGIGVKMYFDGAQISITGTNSAYWSSHLSLTGSFIGYYVGWNWPAFNGLIDDVRIYNYARTADEIRLDYNAGFAAKFGPTGADCDRDPGSCMTKGLVGYWNFEDRRGTTTLDTSGNNNHGYFATAASSPAWTQGKVGSALSFDGTDDYVDAGNGSSIGLGNTSFTLETWVRHSTGGSGIIIGKGSQISGKRIQFRGGQNSVYRFSFWTDALDSAVYDDRNSFVHLVATYDVSTGARKIYRNGVQIASDITTATYDGTGNLQIGAHTAASDYFNGLIDEVRVYNRALSAAEVRYHYNRGGPVAQWKFDEGSATTTFDSSGNNNTGYFQTAASSPTWVQGKSGSALSFDGVNDYVSMPSFNFGTLFTVSFWMKINKLYDYGDALGRDAYLTFTTYADGHMLFGVGDGAWGNFVNPGVGTLSEGVWYHVVGTYNGTKTELFINGVSKGTAANTKNVGSTAFYIGMRKGDYYPFNGLIDDVRIYNYARTADQIMQDYNGGFNTYFK